MLAAKSLRASGDSLLPCLIMISVGSVAETGPSRVRSAAGRSPVLRINSPQSSLKTRLSSSVNVSGFDNNQSASRSMARL